MKNAEQTQNIIIKKTVLALIFIMIDSINIVHHCFQCPYIAYIQQTKKKFLSM